MLGSSRESLAACSAAAKLLGLSNVVAVDDGHDEDHAVPLLVECCPLAVSGSQG